ncbi:uncharacterized protein LOC132967170 isoform X2 [Labrus mixtus]|uniref:uncharacterized protein LOC132967170 isoform X2 n=1 Tax=Labrus mixtus TaxID=508554 RepID=UPI0029BFEEA5|nr:uncharacterized protein LOC132967170 isoform X2 [Labrus mixtus]
MASPGSLSLPGLQQPSVYLVDCLKIPAHLGAAESLQPEDGPRVLVVRGLSVCLVDCMRTPGLRSQMVHLAAEQTEASVDLELKEEYEGNQLMYLKEDELDQHPDRCGTGADICDDGSDREGDGGGGSGGVISLKQDQELCDTKSQTRPSHDATTLVPHEEEAEEPGGKCLNLNLKDLETYRQDDTSELLSLLCVLQQ